MKNTRKEINDWVKENTMGKIKDLIPPGSFNSETSLVLVNAIYYHGKWKSAFKVSSTMKMPFVIPNTNSSDSEHSHYVDVDMMRQVDEFEHCRPNTIEAQVLRMPYDETDLSMLVILPNKLDGLLDVVENMSKFNYEECFIQKSMKHKIDLEIPKFTIKAEYNMKQFLKSLGATDMFEKGIANFSGIEHDLWVEEVFHGVYIKVNEEGSEAAAAAATTGDQVHGHLPMALQPPIPFHCDRPFMFLIVDNKYGTVLSYGTVSNPNEGKEDKSYNGGITTDAVEMSTKTMKKLGDW
jgi:serpin B